MLKAVIAAAFFLSSIAVDTTNVWPCLGRAPHSRGGEE